jgi:hypothetical protein
VTLLYIRDGLDLIIGPEALNLHGFSRKPHAG